MVLGAPGALALQARAAPGALVLQALAAPAELAVGLSPEGRAARYVFSVRLR